MRSIKKRAWLVLVSMCPAYAVYVAVKVIALASLPIIAARIGCLALCAGALAAVYLVRLALIERQERGQRLLQDKRDRNIDARATHVAYSALCTGMILVGVIMPFGNSGWMLVNAALFFIVLTETLRHAWIVTGYRGAVRFAY